VNVQRPPAHVSLVVGSSSSQTGGFEQAAMPGFMGSQASCVHGSASLHEVIETVRSTTADTPGVSAALSCVLPPS